MRRGGPFGGGKRHASHGPPHTGPGAEAEEPRSPFFDRLRTVKSKLSSPILRTDPITVPTNKEMPPIRRDERAPRQAPSPRDDQAGQPLRGKYSMGALRSSTPRRPEQNARSSPHPMASYAATPDNMFDDYPELGGAIPPAHQAHEFTGSPRLTPSGSPHSGSHGFDSPYPRMSSGRHSSQAYAPQLMHTPETDRTRRMPQTEPPAPRRPNKGGRFQTFLRKLSSPMTSHDQSALDVIGAEQQSPVRPEQQRGFNNRGPSSAPGYGPTEQRGFVEPREEARLRARGAPRNAERAAPDVRARMRAAVPASLAEPREGEQSLTRSESTTRDSFCTAHTDYESSEEQEFEAAEGPASIETDSGGDSPETPRIKDTLPGMWPEAHEEAQAPAKTEAPTKAEAPAKAESPSKTESPAKTGARDATPTKPATVTTPAEEPSVRAARHPSMAPSAAGSSTDALSDRHTSHGSLFSNATLSTVPTSVGASSGTPSKSGSNTSISGAPSSNSPSAAKNTSTERSPKLGGFSLAAFRRPGILFKPNQVPPSVQEHPSPDEDTKATPRTEPKTLQEEPPKVEEPDDMPTPTPAGAPQLAEPEAEAPKEEAPHTSSMEEPRLSLHLDEDWDLGIDFDPVGFPAPELTRSEYFSPQKLLGDRAAELMAPQTYISEYATQQPIYEERATGYPEYVQQTWYPDYQQQEYNQPDGQQQGGYSSQYEQQGYGQQGYGQYGHYDYSQTNYPQGGDYTYYGSPSTMPQLPAQGYEQFHAYQPQAPISSAGAYLGEVPTKDVPEPRRTLKRVPPPMLPSDTPGQADVSAGLPDYLRNSAAQPSYIPDRRGQGEGHALPAINHGF